MGPLPPMIVLSVVPFHQCLNPRHFRCSHLVLRVWAS